MVVVKRILKPERIAYRQPPIFGKALQRLRRLHRPPAAAGNHKRSLGREQHFAQGTQRAGIAPRLHRLDAQQGLRHAASDRMRHHRRGQHVFRQDQYHRPGSTIHRSGKGARHVFRDTRHVVDAFHTFGHAFGTWAEETAEVNLLERLPVARFSRDISDKQHHRRGILERGMHPNRRVGGTRPARHKTHTRSPGQFAVRLGHECRPTLLPVDHKRDLVRMQVKTVQYRQITFARHAEGMGYTLGKQAFDQQVAANFYRFRLSHGPILRLRETTTQSLNDKLSPTQAGRATGPVRMPTPSAAPTLSSNISAAP